ncbi:hypothetical protein [Streptomyces sp. NBC_01384]
MRRLYRDWDTLTAQAVGYLCSSPACRRSCPHSRQIRGGCLLCRGREQWPHQPVSFRRQPGLPQCEHDCWAARWPALRRQSRHRPFCGDRMGWPHCSQTREQVMHRPMSCCRTRSRPQPGQEALAAERSRWHLENRSTTAGINEDLGSGIGPGGSGSSCEGTSARPR